WVWGPTSACAVIVLILSPMLSLRRAAWPARSESSGLQAPEPQREVRAVSRISVPPMIARTSQLSLTTKEFDKARRGLEDILKRHAGYLGELNASAPVGA